MHVGLENEYNSVHPHARCEINNTISGVYYNSESNLSAYIGKKYSIFEYGVVTGYSGMDLAPMIRIKKDNWFIAPAYEVGGNVGLVIGLEFKLYP
tara:strand:+ start:209 stop:493 length:285 start_codon:yes stop_codon:yes gene_type:complete